jgi:hypothetical protein
MLLWNLIFVKVLVIRRGWDSFMNKKFTCFIVEKGVDPLEPSDACGSQTAQHTCWPIVAILGYFPLCFSLPPPFLSFSCVRVCMERLNPVIIIPAFLRLHPDLSTAPKGLSWFIFSNSFNLPLLFSVCCMGLYFFRFVWPSCILCLWMHWGVLEFKTPNPWVGGHIWNLPSFKGKYHGSFLNNLMCINC